MNRYLEMDDDDGDCLAFWRRNQVNLNTLVYPAICALSSKFSNVFSNGGVILRPHRGRMSNKLLSNLIFFNRIFLKHNKSLLL